VLIGLVLAAVVLMAFLRSWRATLIAVLVVPAVLSSTVLVLSILGMSFNIMTLGGVAAAVGLLIDDVIVMIEHIARRAGARPADDEASRLEGAGDQSRLRGREAVLPAAREFMAPLTGSSLATLLFVRGDRRFFKGSVGHHGRSPDPVLSLHRRRRADLGADHS
jgi:multidrug efflux pump subunit AcrB